MRADEDPELVYQLLKWMDEEHDSYKDDFTHAHMMSIENLVAFLDNGALQPLHEGAIRYLEELGVWTEEHQVRQDRLVEMAQAQEAGYRAAIEAAGGRRHRHRRPDNQAWIDFWRDYRAENGLPEKLRPDGARAELMVRPGRPRHAGGRPIFHDPASRRARHSPLERLQLCLSEKDKALSQEAVPADLRDRTLERWQSMPLAVRVILQAMSAAGGPSGRRLHLRHRAVPGRDLLFPSHGALSAVGSYLLLPAYKGEMRVGIFSYIPALGHLRPDAFHGLYGPLADLPDLGAGLPYLAAGRGRRHLHPDPRRGPAGVPGGYIFLGIVLALSLYPIYAVYMPGMFLGSSHDARSDRRVQRLFRRCHAGRRHPSCRRKTIIGFLILAALLVAHRCRRPFF